MARHSPTRRSVVIGGLAALGVGAAIVAGSLTAADHRDSTLLTNNPTQDIADVYGFLSPRDPSKVVFGVTLAGFIPPTEVGLRTFGQGVLYQIKLDTNGDAVEDQVIQAYLVNRGGRDLMRFVGPFRPSRTGTTSRLQLEPLLGEVQVSGGAQANIYSRNGVKLFAGLRDDPFFFDLAQFNEIIAGRASSFNNPGTDTFAGFNALAMVVELPMSLLGGATTLGVWGTTSVASGSVQ
jgi:hypothetical protein